MGLSFKVLLFIVRELYTGPQSWGGTTRDSKFLPPELGGRGANAGLKDINQKRVYTEGKFKDFYYPASPAQAPLAKPQALQETLHLDAFA
jgi:hypothetical protein